MGCGNSQTVKKAHSRPTKNISEVKANDLFVTKTGNFTKNYILGSSLGKGAFAEVRSCTHKITN